MITVFADTMYWVAVARPNDPWKQSAERATSEVGSAVILTTDEVLTEFLNTLCKCGERLRRQAVKMVRAILDNANVKVLPQTRDSFLGGVRLYEQRADKEYSLTDCISMNAMSAQSVTKILTNDRHFQQEGFEVLMTKQQERSQ